MKLAVSGLLPSDPGEVDAAAVEAVREAGFGAATLFLFADHAGIDDAGCARMAAAFAAADVELVQLGAWMCPVLDHDEDRREASRLQRREALRVASALGARSIAVGPGTLSPRGASGFEALEEAWYPAAENASEAAFDALVGQLREDAAYAGELGVHIALECHMFTPLSTPERTRAVIEAVDSPWVKVTADPANWITPLEYFTTGAFIDGMFDVLGDAILDAHAKDLGLEDSMHIHTSDAVPGDGEIDFVTFLRRMQRTNPEAAVVIEHVAPEDVPRAREHVLEAARAAGVMLT
jgi:sugar phosphate isomerase/epimerase